MVEWMNTVDLPQAVRNFVIDTLVHLEPFTQFYKYGNGEDILVQVHLDFEVQTRNGITYTLKFVLDVDSEHKGKSAHMGYEIHLNKKKEQVGHVAVSGNVTGRPAPPGIFDRSTNKTDGPYGEKNPIKDTKNISNGKGTWKCTFWTVKKRE